MTSVVIHVLMALALGLDCWSNYRWGMFLVWPR